MRMSHGMTNQENETAEINEIEDSDEIYTFVDLSLKNRPVGLQESGRMTTCDSPASDHLAFVVEAGQGGIRAVMNPWLGPQQPET